jgi:hypothetical protein
MGMSREADALPFFRAGIDDPPEIFAVLDLVHLGGEPAVAADPVLHRLGIIGHVGWVERSDIHQARDESDFARHVDYIHIKSGQAWAGEKGRGLAAFVLSPHDETRSLSRGLVGRCP